MSRTERQLARFGRVLGTLIAEMSSQTFVSEDFWPQSSCQIPKVFRDRSPNPLAPTSLQIDIARIAMRGLNSRRLSPS